MDYKKYNAKTENKIEIPEEVMKQMQKNKQNIALCNVINKTKLIIKKQSVMLHGLFFYLHTEFIL